MKPVPAVDVFSITNARRISSSELLVSAYIVCDIGQIMSLVEMLGFGPQATFALFSNQFKQTTVSAQVDNVKAANLLGGNTLSFKATSQAACREKALDMPGTSITAYRQSVYLTNILGWAF